MATAIVYPILRGMKPVPQEESEGAPRKGHASGSRYHRTATTQWRAAMSDILKGKVIAITGAFGFLGTVVTQLVAEPGATVAAIDRAANPHTPFTAAAIRSWSGTDLSVPGTPDSTFKSIADAFGGIDSLVNLAGTFRWET